MRRHILFVLCIIAICASCAHAAIDVCLDTGAPISGSTINVNADALAATGTEYVRINFILGSWSSPTDGTLYNGMTWFQCYDSIINSLTSRGIKVYGLIGAEAVKNAGGYNADQFVNAYTTNFVAIVNHFKDRVRVYESFNEPNDWAGGQSAQVEPYWFAKMLQQIYLEVKINNGHSSDPSWQVTLVSGPLFGHDMYSSYDDTAAPYLDSVYSAGINQLSWTWMKNTYGTYPLDGIGYHTYVKQGTNTEQAVIDRLNYNVDSIWGIVSNYEGSGSSKKIWISECGWNTASISESEQARNVTTALTTFSNHSRVAFGTWFTLCDFGTTSKWGLFRTTPFTDTNKKPSWTSFHDYAVANNGSGTGTISGNVKNQAAENMSGVTITTSPATSTVTTDANGNYTISNVTAGTYSVTASKSGFNSSTQSGKTVSANATTTVNFTLSFIDNMNSNTPGGSNLALSATSATADSQYQTSQAPAYAKDNTISTKWCSTNASSTHWLAYDLGATKTVNGYILRGAGLNEFTYYNTKNFKIQSGTSTSGPWTDETIVDNSAQANVVTKTYNTAKQLRYIRLYITNSGIDNYARIPEFEVWGATSPTTGTITGNVKSGGVNLSGATVQTNTGGYSTTTDASGNYTLSNVTAGTYNVTASKTGYNSSTNSNVSVTAGQTTTSNFTLTASGGSIVSEDFTTIPSWSSTFDAAWGSAASFTSVTGGQSGNFMQASRTSQGSSSRVKVYTVPTNTNITISVYMKCPSYAGSYWMECAYKFGNNSATDFDSNSATWTYIKKFANDGTNGNGNTWTQYSVTANTGSNTQISIGYKHGASGNNGPTVGWDTFRIQ